MTRPMPAQPQTRAQVARRATLTAAAAPKKMATRPSSTNTTPISSREKIIIIRTLSSSPRMLPVPSLPFPFPFFSSLPSSLSYSLLLPDAASAESTSTISHDEAVTATVMDSVTSAISHIRSKKVAQRKKYFSSVLLPFSFLCF